MRAGRSSAFAIKVADWSGKSRATIVFVHGLGGHPYDTWRRSADGDTYWPIWLAEGGEIKMIDSGHWSVRMKLDLRQFPGDRYDFALDDRVDQTGDSGPGVH